MHVLPKWGRERRPLRAGGQADRPKQPFGGWEELWGGGGLFSLGGLSRSGRFPCRGPGSLLSGLYRFVFPTLFLVSLFSFLVSFLSLLPPSEILLPFPSSHTPPPSPSLPPLPAFQLAGFLFNNGTVELCDVKLAPLNAPGVTAFWPDWASDASYEKYFNLKQMTSVGLTATPNADGSLPSVEIISLRACDPTKDATVPVAAEGGVEVPAEGGVEVPMEDGVATVFPLETRKIALEDSPMMPPVKKEVLGEEPTGFGPEIVPNARRLASEGLVEAEDAGEAGAEEGPEVGEDTTKATSGEGVELLLAGDCGIYQNGTVSLTLCLESVLAPTQSMAIYHGFLYNNGTAPACDVRLRPVNAPGLIQLWPDWSPTSAYEVYFNPKQVRDGGMVEGKAGSPRLGRGSGWGGIPGRGGGNEWIAISCSIFYRVLGGEDF